MIKAVENQFFFRTHFFHTKVLHQFYVFTQMEKKIRVGRGKKVGSNHRNQTYFFISPNLHNRLTHTC